MRITTRTFLTIAACVFLHVLAEQIAKERFPVHAKEIKFISGALSWLFLMSFLVWPLTRDVAFGKLRAAIYSIVVPIPGKIEDGESRTISGWVAISSLVVIALILTLLLVDYVSHGDALAPGTFGDFFGGVLNPVLTFFTFIALSITVVMQRNQLREFKLDSVENGRVVSIRAFETTFFNLLSLHNSLVEGLRFNAAILQRTGTIKQQEGDSSTEVWPVKVVPAEGRRVFEEVVAAMRKRAGGKKSAMEVYDEIQNRHNYVLGHYFRNLFQIINLIDRHATRTLSEGDVAEYRSILRAQLSSHELLLLLYNCSTGMVDSGRFRTLVKKFKLLEHLPLRVRRLGGVKLVVPMFGPLEPGLFEQYLDLSSSSGIPTVISTGAFGENPVVKDFLASKKISSK